MAVVASEEIFGLVAVVDAQHLLLDLAVELERVLVLVEMLHEIYTLVGQLLNALLAIFSLSHVKSTCLDQLLELLDDAQYLEPARVCYVVVDGSPVLHSQKTFVHRIGRSIITR